MTMRSPGASLPLFTGAPVEALAKLGFDLKRMLEGKSGRRVPRHLFGPASPEELYAGRGLDEAGRTATRLMLARLAAFMKVCSWPGADRDDNPDMPAGYTYLAQLATHDLVQNAAPLPRLDDAGAYFERDLRTDRLALETIYGGGPAATPLHFAIAGGRRQRHELRLGRVVCQEAEAGRPRPQPLDGEPARDIARVSCPHLRDVPGPGVPDALVADPRNDDHLILSQLTALFHELHNIIYAKLDDRHGPIAPHLEDFRIYRTVLEARKVTALAWRRVVENDLLRRLLDPSIFDAYAASGPGGPAFLDRSDDGRVPLEFSHAAFRCGHAMIRFSYLLNGLRRNGEELETAGINEIIERSSSRQAARLPVASNWLVDWSRFFDMGGGTALNLARCLRPVMRGSLTSDTFFPNEDGADGGLVYRDLIRSADAGLRSVASLIAKLPPEDRARSQLLSDPGFRENRIGQWLEQVPQHWPDPADKVSLSKDPPLFLFLLFEAAHDANGRRFGVLGSRIVAEVFFAALRRGRPTIEDDPAIAGLVATVFGGGVPADMPSIIRFIKDNGGLADVSCPA